MAPKLKENCTHMFAVAALNTFLLCSVDISMIDGFPGGTSSIIKLSKDAKKNLLKRS